MCLDTAIGFSQPKSLLKVVWGLLGTEVVWIIICMLKCQPAYCFENNLIDRKQCRKFKLSAVG